jgi:hypothetical protein
VHRLLTAPDPTLDQVDLEVVDADDGRPGVGLG